VYTVDREENAELSTIDALIESGLICVFPNKGGAEIRGYGSKIQVSGHGHEGMPLTRDLAIRLVLRVVRENREKIEERREKAAMERYSREREEGVEFEHD